MANELINVPLSNLKAYYRFESGALTTDSSGNGHTLSAISDPAETTGKFGGGVAFDGNDGYTITDHSDLKPTGSFTVGMWIKSSTTGANQLYAQNYSTNGATGAAGWYISWLNAFSAAQFRTYRNTGSTQGVDWQRVVGSTNIHDGNLHWVVGVFDGSYLRLYVDGNADATPVAWTYGAAYVATQYPRIGCFSADGTNAFFFTGDMDDAFLLNGTALSATEISDIYNYYYKNQVDSGTGSDTNNQLERTQTDSGTGSDSAVKFQNVGTDWLSGYTYRMKCEFANEYLAGNKSFSFKFPAWWLKEKSKIANANYYDIRVVTADGLLLPHNINADHDTLTVDYPNMQLGRSYVYIYYGNSGADQNFSALGTLDSSIQVMEANEEVTENGTDFTWYVWGENIDDAGLNSSAADTYYGANTSFDVGWIYSSTKKHYLNKFFEGALPLGTISSAKLNLYLMTPSSYNGDGSLKLHRILSPSSSGQPVGDGWMDQNVESYPTWNKKNYNRATGATEAISWFGSAGCSTAGTDISNDGDEPTLNLSTNYTAGYRDFTIPTTWIDTWIDTDSFSMGVLIKDTDESGLTSKMAIISGNKNGDKAKRCVWEVVYSAYDDDQYLRRKLSSNTYQYTTFSTHRHFVEIPSENGFAVMVYVNNNLRIDICYISPDGKISRIKKDAYPASSRLYYNSPCFGLYYDEIEKRYWLAGNDSNTKLVLAYTPQGKADSLTWVAHSSETAAKSSIYIENSLIYAVYYNYSGQTKYITYNRLTDTWSSPVEIATKTAGGTMRAIATDHAILSTDVMNGEGEIYLNGAVTSYSDWGVVTIDSERFHYKAKDAVNNKLTGVTRAIDGTSAANHSVGATVSQYRNDLTYIGVVKDKILNCIHVVYILNAVTVYIYIGYCRHYLNEADNVWKDESDNALTLPINNTNERIVGTPTNVMWTYDGINALSSGDVIIFLRPSVLLQGTNPGTLTARLLSGETTWTYDYLGIQTYETSATEIGTSGYIACTYLGGTTAEPLMRRINSYDFGDTWSSPVTLSSYAFDNQGLWCSSCTSDGNFSGNGLMYANHFTNYGTLYLQEVSYFNPKTDSDSGTGSELAIKFNDETDSGTGDETPDVLNTFTETESGIGTESESVLSLIADTDSGEGAENETTLYLITQDDTGTVTEVVTITATVNASDSAVFTEEEFLSILAGSPVLYKNNNIMLDSIGGLVTKLGNSKINTWNTDGRPEGKRGMIGYNFEIGCLEMYDGPNWIQILSSNVTKITENKTLTPVDTKVMVSNETTVTLPTAVGIVGKEYNIIRIGTSNVTIATSGVETISGDSNLVLTSRWDSVVVISDGYNWVRCS